MNFPQNLAKSKRPLFYTYEFIWISPSTTFYTYLEIDWNRIDIARSSCYIDPGEPELHGGQIRNRDVIRKYNGAVPAFVYAACGPPADWILNGYGVVAVEGEPLDGDDEFDI